MAAGRAIKNKKESKKLTGTHSKIKFEWEQNQQSKTYEVYGLNFKIKYSGTSVIE